MECGSHVWGGFPVFLLLWIECSLRFFVPLSSPPKPRRIAASLFIFYRHFHADWFSELADYMPPPADSLHSSFCLFSSLIYSNSFCKIYPVGISMDSLILLVTAEPTFCFSIFSLWLVTLQKAQDTSPSESGRHFLTSSLLWNSAVGGLFFIYILPLKWLLHCERKNPWDDQQLWGMRWLSG